jgi:hypothetical protein
MFLLLVSLVPHLPVCLSPFLYVFLSVFLFMSVSYRMSLYVCIKRVCISVSLCLCTFMSLYLNVTFVFPYFSVCLSTCCMSFFVHMLYVFLFVCMSTCCIILCISISLHACMSLFFCIKIFLFVVTLTKEPR